MLVCSTRVGKYDIDTFRFVDGSGRDAYYIYSSRHGSDRYNPEGGARTLEEAMSRHAAAVAKHLQKEKP